MPHRRYWLSKIKCIKIFYLHFCKVLVSWKMPIWLCSGLNYSRFEEFIHNAESVTQIIYAWWVIPHNKIVPKCIQASWLVVLISYDSITFHTWSLILSKNINVHYFHPKNYLIWNKTARIMAKPWMLRLPFKVYGAAEKKTKKN